jgi:hypothetical protein
MVLAEDLAAYLVRFDEHSLGHDLWLTAAGHGAGFWDRGLGAAGARLTAYAKLFPMDAYHHKDLLELQ